MTANSRPEIPEPVYTLTDFDLDDPAKARKGDTLNGRKVGEVKSGPKWVHIFDEDGRSIIRVPRDGITRLVVQRPVETEESQEARRLAYRTESILRAIPASRKRLEDYGLEVATRCSNGGRGPDWSLYTNLFQAQAEAQLWDVVAHLIESREATPIEAHDMVIERCKKDLLEGHSIRGISRSTNQISNLMDEVSNEAKVDFIRKSHLYF